ncbi:ATP-dependent DNA helicase [Flavobacterium branchiophilum]|uniref:Uncharacterized protein n=1 Tax=Flavobacterium branchiophilum TaxID=55197 RepID=A0A2H3KV18_9FLAO|nr:AAA family ATPase [Flavobacterium branchiophilum]PDS22406.1 hypothetical protein B0A77_13525 [Flavobacterium branchiophilum]
MSIFNHFHNIKLSEGQSTALTKLEQFINGTNQIFVLKGYAGTGKTTLLAGVTKYLENEKKMFQVMAPTGRAAKILKEKTGHGKTIHSYIYNLEKIDFKNQKEDIEKQSFLYSFPIRELECETILIVDESSMISSRENKQELFSFGTNILLQDLLTYSKISTTNNKIIFVGDPAQLPPVGDNKSWVFFKELFQKKGLSYEDYELTEVKRQKDNLILKNAGVFRDCIHSENPTMLELYSDAESFIKIKPEEAIDTYVSLSPIPEIDSSVIICYSNKQCYDNNIAIRNRIFPNNSKVCPGDIIQIIHNNYRTYGIDIMNGDFAKILKVSEEIVKLTAPVWNEKNGTAKAEKIQVTNTFRRVTIRINNTEIEAMVFDDLLHSIDRDLSVLQMKSLYINFIMRFDAIQKERELKGLVKYKRYSREFSEMLVNDKYYNAIRCKFGYAITCHKAQGGEWKNTIVDYSGRVSLKKDALRWAYTATTRASEKCFAINAPQFNQFSKFEILEIVQIANFPKNALDFSNTLFSPIHLESAPLCVHHKYWEIIEKIEDTNFRINTVNSFPWLERYQLMYDEDTLITLDGSYNGAGFFKNGFVVTSACEKSIKLEIETIFNKSYIFNTNLKIEFNQKQLIELFAVMQDFCDELNIVITNIAHNEGQFYVNYYLKTDAICAYIQFYYNINFQLTIAMPKSIEGKEDEKLVKLLKELDNYAS